MCTSSTTGSFSSVSPATRSKTLVDPDVLQWRVKCGSAGQNGKFCDAELPVFLLAKDGNIVADDATNVTFGELGTHRDKGTGKPVANVTRFTSTGARTRSEPCRCIIRFG